MRVICKVQTNLLHYVNIHQQNKFYIMIFIPFYCLLLEREKTRLNLSLRNIFIPFFIYYIFFSMWTLKNKLVDLLWYKEMWHTSIFFILFSFISLSSHPLSSTYYFCYFILVKCFIIIWDIKSVRHRYNHIWSICPLLSFCSFKMRNAQWKK